MAQNFNKTEYMRKYNKEKIIRKSVKFNMLNDEDIALLDYLEDIPFTQGKSMNKFIKELIKKDMLEHEKD
jgi:hypothetical protein